MLPLDGLRVLDLSRFLSGPYCTMVLAELGADVIKVEQPGTGDDSRALGPKINGESYPAAMVNRSKRSISLDLKSDRGRKAFLRLASEVDVIVENFRPGVVSRLGIDYEAVRRVREDVIYCSISGFGQTGPYKDRPGFDIMAQGLVGFLRMTGQSDGRPAKVGIAINDLAAGNTAVQAILAAQIMRGRTGDGQYIDISLVDAALAWTLWEAGAWFGCNEVPQPSGTRHRRSSPYQAYRTSDGYVTIGANNERQWRTLALEVFQMPQWMDDVRFATVESRMAHVDALETEIEQLTVAKATSWWIELLDRVGIPVGPVLTYDEALSDPQIQARGMVIEMEHPVIGPMKTVGAGAKFSGFDYTVRSPAPWLGQHTEEVLLEAGLTESEIAILFERGTAYDARRSGDVQGDSDE